MKTKLRNKRLHTSLTALCAAMISLGLTAGSVLAVEVSEEDYKLLQALKKKQAEEQLPPHERLAPAEPDAPKGNKVSEEDYKMLQARKKKQAEEQLPPHERPAPKNHPGDKSGNLAEAATNPIANLMQFQLQNKYSWDSHNSSGYANTFVIQPVIPFNLPFKKVPLLITRSTLPYVSTPDLGDPIGRKHGFGDFTFLGLFTGALAKGQTVGLGPSLVIPTAGNNSFTGSGKWQAGPAFVYINTQTPKLQWGFLGWQHWSFADGPDGSGREDVSELSWQPFLNYHFNKGWFIGTPDDPQKYDWKANGFTWNLGFQFGRVFKIGKLPVKLFVEPEYNPNAAGGSPSRWGVKFNLTLLFPK